MEFESLVLAPHKLQMHNRKPFAWLADLSIDYSRAAWGDGGGRWSFDTDENMRRKNL